MDVEDFVPHFQILLKKRINKDASKMLGSTF